MIRVQVEMIDISHEKMTELLTAEKVPTDTELRKTVGELIKKKEAKILETMMVVARSGQKATAESIEEFIYPTEYEPGQLPENIHVGEKGKTENIDGRKLAIGPTPTAFETRNLGTTLEVEPNLGESGKYVDLRFAPEIVFHVKNITWADWKGELGDSPIQMPVMYSIRTSTGVTARVGKYRLVSAVSPKSEEGHPDFDRKLLMFVRCDVVPTE